MRVLARFTRVTGDGQILDLASPPRNIATSARMPRSAHPGSPAQRLSLVISRLTALDLRDAQAGALSAPAES